MSCPNLAVPRDVMHHVVRVESSYNPYAIGVVGGRLVRQPRSLAEAVSTARMLEQRGYNFSLGLAQVNRYNLAKYGLQSYEHAFQPCANLVAGSRILRECYGRSGGDWGKSFSCYYSGDFKTGYRHGYVQKVYASMRRGQGAPAAWNNVAPVQVVDRVVRRTRTGAPRVAAAPQDPVPRSLVERRGAHGSGAAPTSGTPAQAAASPASLAASFAAQPPSVLASTPTPQAPAPLRSGAPVVVTATQPGVAPSPQAPGGGDNAFVF